MPKHLRSKTAHFVLGQPDCLPANKLPLESEVYNFYKAESLRLRQVNSRATQRSIAVEVAKSVREIWVEKAGLPVFSLEGTVRYVLSVVAKGRKLSKTPSTKRKRGNGAAHGLDRLFDICPCQCKARSRCMCEKKDKVPPAEWKFLRDQRGKRQQVIGAIDVKGTRAIARRRRRSAGRDSPADASGSTAQELQEHADISVDSADPSPADSVNEAENTISGTTATSSESVQNRIVISNFARECDRYQLSDRAAAALGSALLTDVGIVSETDQSSLITRSKVRRARDTWRKERKEELKEQLHGKLQCVGFDGKRDITQVIEETVESGEIVRTKSTKREEHIVYVSEPGGTYIDHSTLDSGTSKSVARNLTDLIRETESEDTLQAVLADGTNVNTGWRNGAIVEVERDLEKNLQWLICLLHTNELPLRHLFTAMDGGHGTTGPKTFKGPLGQRLCGDVHQLPVVEYQPIPTYVQQPTDDVRSDLSSDQQLLLIYCQAVADGRIPVTTARRKPGPVNHSRWLTLATRLLILYTRTDQPSESLVRLVRYIQQVYAPMWFAVKSNPSFDKGAVHLFQLMQLLKQQPQEVQNATREVVQRNAYFAHCENVLTAMLVDRDSAVRDQAVSKILTARKSKSRALRVFRVPRLNWQAEHFTEMISWCGQVTEPPVTKQLSDTEIKTARDHPLELPSFPCHSQSVERCVKLVTEACQAVYGYENRHSMIVSRQAARKGRKRSNNKADYRM